MHSLSSLFFSDKFVITNRKNPILVFRSVFLYLLNTERKRQDIYSHCNKKNANNNRDKFWKNDHRNSKNNEKSTNNSHNIYCKSLKISIPATYIIKISSKINPRELIICSPLRIFSREKPSVFPML